MYGTHISTQPEIVGISKHGVHDIFRERGNGQSNMFCEADIDQILSRSAVVIHDRKKSGAMSASATSFSKAFFVVSGGAINDVYIDDGLEDGVGRQRKCRDVFASYKGPGASMKRISKLSNTSSASESDNEDEVSDQDENDYAETGFKKMKVKRQDGQGEADWTEGNLSKILTVMLYVGYGNWRAVRAVSRF